MAADKKTTTGGRRPGGTLVPTVTHLDLQVDPPLLEDEIEIDLADCYERAVDPLATVRATVTVEERLRIERLVAERRREIERLRQLAEPDVDA